MDGIRLSVMRARHGLTLAVLLAGMAGMIASYVYLASAHQLDVIAGAAGFVAGSILVAGSLVALALAHPVALSGSQADLVERSEVLPQSLVERWLAHFRRNRANRSEPDWSAPITLPAETIKPLVRSLAQFQLGDGGGPASLIAWNGDDFRASSGNRALHDAWFTEEREHARLLGGAVARFGGQCIRGHWSFSVFCGVRYWLGVRFELTVLLLTEIVSTVYYRLLHRHGDDPALRAMCRLILRDEHGHVAFHRDRLASAAQPRYGLIWEMYFRTLGLLAGTMLWINHRPGVCALGASTREFYREIWQEMSRFIRRLRRQLAAQRGNDTLA